MDAVHRAGRLGRIVLAVVMLAVGVGLGMGTMAVASGDGEVYHACVNPNSGTIKMIDADASCNKNDTRISWNERGLEGPQGLQGPQGEPGPAGPAGATGPMGPAGAGLSCDNQIVLKKLDRAFQVESDCDAQLVQTPGPQALTVHLDEPTILTITNIGGQLAPAISAVSPAKLTPFEYTTTCEVGLRLGQDESCDISVRLRGAKGNSSQVLTVKFDDGSVIQWTVQTANFDG
jgi:hypothetical protein